MKKLIENIERQLLQEGYTHYWKSEGFTDEEWKKLVAEVNKIIRAAKSDGIELAGMDGTGTPKVTDTFIGLNGKEPEAYETFHLTKAPQDFEFTKTEHRPYDPVVVSILAAAKKISKSFDPSSDGGMEAIKRVY